MAQLQANPQTLDARYQNFKVLVKFDGKVVAAASEIHLPKRSAEIIEYRSGGDPLSVRKLPGRTKYEPITLQRGVTSDPGFSQWAAGVRQRGNGRRASIFLKDIALEIYGPAGVKVRTYNIRKSWVSEYNSLPSLDANGNVIAIQHIKIENEGWDSYPP
jgi:phage tail-like protein